MRYAETRVAPRNPMVHFTDVASTIVKVFLIRRPLRTMGIPGLALLAIGMYGWLDVLATYNAAQGFALGHALVYTVILLSGMFTVIAAILLSAVRMAVQQVQ